MGFFLTALWTLAWVAFFAVPVALFILLWKRIKALVVELGRVSGRLTQTGSDLGKDPNAANQLHLAQVPRSSRCLEENIIPEMLQQRENIADRREGAKLKRLHKAQARWARIKL